MYSDSLTTGVILGCAFYTAQSLDIRLVLAPPEQSSSTQGMKHRRFMIAAIYGCMLVAGLGVAIRNPIAHLGFLQLLLATSIILAPISMLWASDKKHCIFSSLCWSALGVTALALGLSNHLTNCLTMVLAGAITCLLIGCVEELKTGSPLPGCYYRFWGGIGCNDQSIHAALVCLSGYYLYQVGVLPLWSLILILPSALLIMVLTRSLASFWALSAAALAWFIHANFDTPKVLMYFLLPLLLGIAAVLFIPAVRGRVSTAIHLGRVDATISRLSGRWIIWRDLWRTIRKRPLLGVGYGSYWNVNNKTRLMRKYGFKDPIWSAHSIYFESLLDGGIMALGLLLLIASYTLWIAVPTPTLNGSVITALITLVLVTGLAESGFTRPRFSAFSAMLVLGSLGSA